MKFIDDNYFVNDKKEKITGIDSILHDGEEVLWSAVPNRKAFIAQYLFENLPFILPFLLFDTFFIFMFANSMIEILPVILIFAFIHLFPVWKLIYGLLKEKKEIVNIKYYITNERVLVLGGLNVYIKSEVYLKNIKGVSVKQTKTDQIYKVSDLYINGSIGSAVLTDIVDADFIKKQLENLMKDYAQKVRFYQESKICEYCGSTVDKTLKKCPYCGANMAIIYDVRKKK